jgi:hypothetical protein
VVFFQTDFFHHFWRENRVETDGPNPRGTEPGGICVNQVVRDEVRDRLNFAFDDLGEQQVKNITRPVRVYALRPEPTPALTVAAAEAIPRTAPAPRLSIVVLPFANLSSDPEQEYFADGITEDLTTDLSRISGMVVISRNTAFTYRHKRVDTKQNRPRAGCAIRARRQCPPVGQPRPHHSPADRCRD